MPGEEDKADRAANRRARFLAAMQAAESSARPELQPALHRSFKTNAARVPAEMAEGPLFCARLLRECAAQCLSVSCMPVEFL